MSYAKTAEPIDTPFGTLSRVGTRNHILDENAHWRNLANTNEPSMSGCEGPFCQITLSTCLRDWRRRLDALAT